MERIATAIKLASEFTAESGLDWVRWGLFEERTPSVAPIEANFASRNSLCKSAVIITIGLSLAYMASYLEESALANPALNRSLGCLIFAESGPCLSSLLEKAV